MGNGPESSWYYPPFLRPASQQISQQHNATRQSLKKKGAPGWPDCSHPNNSSRSVLEIDSENHVEFSKHKNLADHDHMRLLKRLVEIDGNNLVGPEDQFKNW